MGRFGFWSAVGVFVILLLSMTMTHCGKKTEEISGKIVSGGSGRTMDEFLSRLTRFGFHGSVLAAHGDTILLHKAYGIASVPDSIRNHTSTLFSTGSVTKQFTAAAAIYLESKGQLRVSDSIGRFFDNVPEDKRGITIHHLLTHTSGLSAEYGPDEEELTRDEFLQRVLSLPLSYPIGDHYEYSNAGYSMLAAIIEVVTGTEYETFMVENLFRPVGMNHTGLKTITVPDSMIARSHNAEINYPSPADRPEHYYNLKGNGGMLSTPADMYRWYRALRNGTLFSEELSKKLFIPAVREYEGEDSFYGYGWVIQEYARGDTMIWHNGGAMPHGWSCAVYHFVDDDLLFVVFANAPIEGSLPVDDIVDKLSQIAFRGDYIMPPEIAPVNRAVIEQAAGAYAIEGGELLVSAADDGILIAPDGQAAVDLIFPSPFASRLARYNDLTAELIGHIAAGRFAKAAEYFHGMDDPLGWKTMTREWWQSLSSLGDFKGIHVYGTMMAGGGRTYCRLAFEHEAVMTRFFWMAGRCGGMTVTDQPLARKLLPQSATSFAGYSLHPGVLLTVQCIDSQLVISSGDSHVVANRAAF